MEVTGSLWRRWRSRLQVHMGGSAAVEETEGEEEEETNGCVKDGDVSVRVKMKANMCTCV